MKRDPIERSLGVTDGTSYETLLGHVESFLRAGGILTWDLWMRLGPRTRAACLRAREKIEAERATLIGMAVQGIEQSCHIMAVADHGALQVRTELLRETQRLAAAFGGEAGKGAG